MKLATPEQIRQGLMAEFLRYESATDDEFEAVATTIEEQPRASSWKKVFRSDDEAFLAMVFPHLQRDPACLLLVLINVIVYPEVGAEDFFVQKNMETVHGMIQSFLFDDATVRFNVYRPVEWEAAMGGFSSGAPLVVAKGIIEPAA